MSAYKTLGLSAHAPGLCDLAEVMLSYNSTIAKHPSGNSPPYLAHRWSALSLALKSFTSASKLDLNESGTIFNLPKIHIKRGDCELLRAQLGQVGYEPALANAEILIKNAAKFYVGAEANARNMGLKEEAEEAIFKSALIKGLQGDAGDLKDLVSGDASRVGKLVDEVLQDGLVSAEQLASLQT